MSQAVKIILLLSLLAWLSLVFWNCAKPLPPGMHVVSQVSRLADADVEFSHQSERRPEAPGVEISAIDHAERLIVLDQSPVNREVAQHILARKRLRPNLTVVMVTDPGNPAFGGNSSRILSSLEQSGIIVARVRLDRLRDSNPLYSGLWRMVFGWWSDPFDEAPGQFSLRRRLRLLNAKSDQRQVGVADDGSGGWTLSIAPDGGDASLTLRGPLALTMIASELQIAAWSTDDDRIPTAPPLESGGLGSIDARFTTEGGILSSLLEGIAASDRGDEIDIAVETLSDRRLIAALMRAAARGTYLKLMMARDAMPNRPVADEFERGGGRIEVRWYSQRQGDSHAKLLVVRHRTDVWMHMGAADFSRRNLGDLNLAAAIELRMPARAAAARAVTQYLDELWSGAAADTESADPSLIAYWRYRIAEATGLSSF